jgi:hypothetical protein
VIGRGFLFAVVVWLAGVAGTTAATAAPAVGEFFNATAGQYQVYAQGSAQVAWDANQFMNGMLREYSRYFSNWSFKPGARVIVFDNVDDFRAYAVDAVTQVHSGLAGYCQLKTDEAGNTFYELVSYEQETLWQVLAHEGFHQFLGHELGLEVPTWLNEGLAQYFETSYVSRGRLQTGAINARRLQAAQALIRAGRAPAVADLLALDRATFYGNAQVAYPLSWALVYYLMTRDGPVYSPSRFRHFLQDLKFNHDAVDSFRRRFGRDTEEWEQDFRRFILQLRPPPAE